MSPFFLAEEKKKKNISRGVVGLITQQLHELTVALSRSKITWPNL